MPDQFAIYRDYADRYERLVAHEDYEGRLLSALAAIRFLEDDLGFRATWVRTDFKFVSLEEAADLLGFFFGAEFAEEVRRNHWIITPECTGIWWTVVE